MSATYTKQTYTVVVINPPMKGSDNYKPRIQCYEVNRNLIYKDKKWVLKKKTD